MSQPKSGAPRSAARVLALLGAALFMLASPLLASCKAAAVSTTPDRILMSDSFTLAAGDLQQLYDAGDTPPGSFNEDGYYESPRFYLFQGDSIQVVITCDAPVTLAADFSSLTGAVETGLNSISEENEPSANIPLNYFDITQGAMPGDTSHSSTQTVNCSTCHPTLGGGAMWQLTYVFPSSKLPTNYYSVPAGYYQLNIYNANSTPADCEFSITLVQP